MEIGSFIELQFNKDKEHFNNISKDNIARLNTGRAAICHAVRVYDVKIIYLPYYQCDTVRDFLQKKNIEVRYYSLDVDFNPILTQEDNTAILIVNYYGIMSQNRMAELSKRYKNVIIDNCQAFFLPPIKECLNVYSARKFQGVPDGSYLIGRGASMYIDSYEQDYSSDTASFLLQRIEYGCEGKAYENRMLNESRLGKSDIKNMSRLTYSILDGIDSDFIIKKRRENFEIACKLFDTVNKLDTQKYYDITCVPMIYPLVIENDEIIDKLLRAGHFQGHFWSYLLNEVNSTSFEYWLSRYIIPITIDQRYGANELYYVKETIGR